MSKMRTAALGLWTLIAGLVVGSTAVQAQAGDSPRVLIVSIDGLRPDVMLLCDTPNLRGLMKRGSFSMWARTTAASVTLPSHVSMLTGVVPEVHTIMWNGDLPLSEMVYPAVPTLFELAKRKGYSTGMVSGKSKFTALSPPGSIDYLWITKASACTETEVTDQAVEIMERDHPAVMFVHFPGVDGTGHAKGWGSPEQRVAVEVADASVGRLLESLAKLGELEKTTIFITADHGGAGRTHGPEDARSRTIPWIIAGPGVRADYDLTRLGKAVDINTFDTFATACLVLGIPIDRPIDGKAIVQAFENTELQVEVRDTKTVTTQPTTQPVSTSSEK